MKMVQIRSIIEETVRVVRISLCLRFQDWLAQLAGKEDRFLVINATKVPKNPLKKLPTNPKHLTQYNLHKPPTSLADPSPTATAPASIKIQLLNPPSSCQLTPTTNRRPARCIHPRHACPSRLRSHQQRHRRSREWDRCPPRTKDIRIARKEHRECLLRHLSRLGERARSNHRWGRRHHR